MPNTVISSAQLKRLQVLWNQHANREMMQNSRAARLCWASAQVNRILSSFKELTLAEASTLINLLQSELGIPESSPATQQRRYRGLIKDRDQAYAAGTEGRRGSREKLTIATQEDLELIDTQLNLMGWTRARLDAFLQSPSSPLSRRSSQHLRTVGDVNRVLWALKRMSKQKVKEEVQA